MLDKEKIKQAVIDLLEGKIKDLELIVDSNHKEVTQGDNKQESKYDTRAIEASYLAGAQKARLVTIRNELALLNQLNVSFTESKIRVGSFVEVLRNEKEKQLLFFTPSTGGESVTINNSKIYIMSMSNPLTREFVGLEKGDDFLYEPTNHEYKISKIN